MKLYEKIYDDLKEQILSGEYSNGALLPTEKELQERYNVSRITAKHAYQLLEEQGYIERIPGKGTILKPTTQKSNKQMIGVVLCDFDSSFGEQLIKSIESQAKEYGYRILLARSFDNHENESKVLEDFVSLGVSGIIIQNCHGAFTKNLVKLFIKEFPVVSVDRFSKSLLIPSVSSDNLGGSIGITEYLLEKGHKNILFASSDTESTSTLTDRLAGFQQAFMNRNIPINSQYLMTDLLSPVSRNQDQMVDDIEKIANAIKETGCTAIVASEYFVAELCEKAKEKLPEELANKIETVCFDHPDSMQAKYTFSHVQQDENELGKLAVHQLCSIIKGNEAKLRTVVPSKLIYQVPSLSFDTVL